MRRIIYTSILCTVAAAAEVGAGVETDISDVNAILRGDSSLLIHPAPLTGPLVTDRPDFTESTDAIPRGHYQIEAGYTFTHDSAGGGTGNHTVGELLLRIGLVDDLELRIELPSFERLASGGMSTSGFSDFGIGVKYKFFEQRGLRPHFGIIGQISAPTGSAAFSSDRVDPEIKLLWAYDLTDRVAIAGNVNFASLTESLDRFFEISSSGTIAVAITDRLGGYVEYFGFYPVDNGAGPTHFLNTGLTYLITDNFQLDARIGTGLNGRAEDVFVGFGFSWRN